MDAKDVVTIGKIVGAHGLLGGVKAKVFTESEVYFQRGSTVDLYWTDGRRQTAAIDRLSPTRTGLLLGFKGVANRDAAQALVGADIVVLRSALPETAPDEYYWHDLIGLHVVNTDDSPLGRITAIIPTGGNDVYVVKGHRGETLIPALADVVVAVDLEQGVMRVNLPEGL